MLKPLPRLKDKSGVKWIWDMFGMITNWNVCFGAKKRKTADSIKMLFLADSIKTLLTWNDRGMCYGKN